MSNLHSVDEGMRRIARRLLDQLDAIVERLGDRYREVPEYAALSDRAMRDEVLPMSRQVVATFLEALVEGREPRLEDGPDIAVIGRRRLEMGVPLEPMLHVYRLAGRTVWETAVAIDDVDGRGLAHLGTLWMDWIDRAATVAAAAYLDASHERLRRLDARRGALLDAVLAARDDAEVAAVVTEFATPLASTYAPVVVVGAAVEGRIDDVLGILPPGTLAGARAGALVALVPDGLNGPTDLVQLVRAVAGAIVAFGRSGAPGGDLRSSLAIAEAVAQAAAARNAPGLYGPDDLLIDQLLAADRRVAAALAALVERVASTDRTGAVLETLEAYLDTGSVPETALKVAAHPNTVVYRLKKVAHLTGFDPRVPAQAASLVLGLSFMESTKGSGRELGFAGRKPVTG